jgi:site-specific DNA recombinase
VFITEFNAEVARIRQVGEATRRQKSDELAQTERGIANVLAAIERGVITETTKDRLLELEGRKSELIAELAETPIRPISIHPSLVKLYRHKVSRLEETLNADGVRSEAADALRGIIREVRLIPDRRTKTLRAVLYSDLDAIVSLAEASKKRRPAGAPRPAKLSMVAGEGFEPPTKGL